MSTQPQENNSLLKNRWLVCLVGPTGSGKSDVALHLAQMLQTDIVSADSRQVYRQLNIGTGKPDKADRKRVRHHLIDVVDPHDVFNVGIYKERADDVIEGLHREGKVPLVVGGTGLYVRILKGGLWNGPGPNWELRGRLQEEEKQYGEGTLHKRLRQLDPDSAERIHPRDLVKIIRALEVYTLLGKPLTVFQQDHRFQENRYRVCYFGLKRSREDLYQRIEQRVDGMINRGLIEEVRGLVKWGCHAAMPSMQSLGYKQVLSFLKGDTDLEEMVRVLKRDTKRYAKRQITWFNREEDIRWISIEKGAHSEEIAEDIYSEIKQEFMKINQPVLSEKRSMAC